MILQHGRCADGRRVSSILVALGLAFKPPRVLLAMAAPCALLLTSCGDGRLPVYPVTGSVFYEGKPAVGAVVTFHPADKDDKTLLPNGTVQDDGTFELTTYEMGDGIPEGEYNVVIYWEKKAPKKGGDDDEAPAQLLPRRYLKPETSGLTVQITPSTTILPPFRLTR